MVAGTDQPISDIDEAIEQAKKIGFPVLIKAAAGGGGKGMRIVEDEKEFKEQLKLAISEAKTFFGDGSVFLERYINSPRHIEIQVLGDQYGNIIHLFERECSIQRRHQKVIEEAPSPILTEELRKAMGECAVNVARSCNYIGAGTVEFIVDENLDFFFLEMNTRLQVEHPITEMITGVDLVKEQINIAQGKELSIKQDDLRINCHSIELRIYAEDPASNFLPDTGLLQTYILPEGPGVRVDNSYAQGMEIPVYYDPMISKLIVWGKDREEAIARMIRAIREYQITGIQSTLPFGNFVMNHASFRSGDFDTHFVNKHFNPEAMVNENADEMKIAAFFSNFLFGQKSLKKQSQTQSPISSNWKRNRINTKF
jgi:acetyl/propionyl-CoA carboxylase alpha subunit